MMISGIGNPRFEPSVAIQTLQALTAAGLIPSTTRLVDLRACLTGLSRDALSRSSVNGFLTAFKASCGPDLQTSLGMSADHFSSLNLVEQMGFLAQGIAFALTPEDPKDSSKTIPLHDNQLSVSDLRLPKVVTEDAVEDLVNQVIQRLEAKKAAGEPGDLVLLLDIDGTIASRHGEIDDATVNALHALSQVDGVKINIVTHSGKWETLRKLIGIKGIDVIGDSGGYKWASDGSVAEWYVDEKYVQAIEEHREALAAIIDRHLPEIPLHVRKQIKVLSMDVDYDQDEMSDEDLKSLGEVIQKIHADCLSYIEEHDLQELLVSSERARKNGDVEVGRYWDLKIRQSVMKDMPVPHLIGEDDVVIVADDDSKYGIPMALAAYDIVGKENSFTFYVAGHSRGEATDVSKLAKLSHNLRHSEDSKKSYQVMTRFLQVLAERLG